VKDCINKFPGKGINKNLAEELKNFWAKLSQKEIISGIENVLENLLDGSENKDKKIELLQKNVLGDQKVKALTREEWLKILEDITLNIYRFIDADSSEGQDILNLFFITFNKYTGKADKNQAFTPDHITDFMAKLTEVDKTKRVLDECCGSGSFLVQAMVKELADCRRNKNEKEAKALMDKVKKKNIFGIEFEEKAYGLATTNMLIHGDGNSNIILGSCFEERKFIVNAKPDIILMNPPYNAKPKMIPEKYQKNWGRASDGKEDPTKGLVFVKYLSDIAKDEDWNGTKLAVLLPMSAAIGTSTIISEMKQALLEDNTLEAVFSLPAEIFYPGASVQACCMLFTLNKPHYDSEGKPNKATFFGYYKDDGFKKKKNLGRVEQFDANGRSKWKEIEERWLKMYRNKSVVAGLSALQEVTGKDEWLCEAYMKTDYSKLTQGDFQRTVNNYVSYLVKTSKIENADESVNTENWKEFLLNDICHITMGNKLDYSNMTMDNPSVNFVGRSAENNGVADKVDYIEGVVPYKAGCVSVALGGSLGMSCVQNEPFYTSQNVSVLDFDDNVSLEAKLFLTTLIMNECKYKYVAFGRELNTHIRNDFSLYLPATPDGAPDWEFMERFMKKYYQGRPKTKIKFRRIPLEIHKWKEFRVGDLFEIKRGLCSDASSLDDGNDLYYIGAKKDDNGVISKVAYDNSLISKGNCIACICDGAGSVGYATYQDKNFIGTVNLRLLYHEKLTTESALFIVPVLDCERVKYSFGRKWRTHLEDTIIKLPADSKGSPDWKFMENYIKSLPYSDKI